jgi:hypothetical protein
MLNETNDNNDNDNMYHSITIDTTLHEVVINPIQKYSCEYFYYMFCCCFVSENDNNHIYSYV